MLFCKKTMGAIIYSCGSTGLEDDFLKRPDETYWDDHISKLTESGWHYDEEFSFYTKRGQHQNPWLTLCR